MSPRLGMALMTVLAAANVAVAAGLRAGQRRGFHGSIERGAPVPPARAHNIRKNHGQRSGNHQAPGPPSHRAINPSSTSPGGWPRGRYGARWAGGDRTRVQRNRACGGVHRHQRLLQLSARGSEHHGAAGCQRDQYPSGSAEGSPAWAAWDPWDPWDRWDPRTRWAPARNLANCEIRARLGGYRSQSVNLVNRRALDDPNIGTILLHRAGASEGTRSAPFRFRRRKTLAKPSRRARTRPKSRSRMRPRRTIRRPWICIPSTPRHGASWVSCSPAKTRRKPPVSPSIRPSRPIPKFVEPYLQVSQIVLRAQQWQELADISDRALKLDPFDYPREFFLTPWRTIT